MLLRGTLALALCALGLTRSPAVAQDTDSLLRTQTFVGRISRLATFEYLLFLPRGTEPARRWPLLLFLHGAGERGTNVWLVAKHGPPKIAPHRADFPFIVVSPQCPEGRIWDQEELLALLDDVVQRYPVDKRRVYLTGLSMGGYGTWGLGLSAPERFAALVPICGGGDPIAVMLAAPERIARLRSLPVWAFHGAKDPVVKLEESERMVKALRQVGCRQVDLTVYPEAEHDCWTETYENPRLYEWLLRHQRE